MKLNSRNWNWLFLDFLDENWSQISFAQAELLTWEKRNPCVLLSMPCRNLVVKTTVLPPNMLHLELYGWCPKPNYQGLYTGKNIKENTPEYSVLLLLQHYIICGWVLFLLAFKQTHVIQLSIISIFDLPRDRLLWFYGVSAFQIAAESGEDTLEQRQAGWYFLRHSTGEGRGCLFFPFLPHPPITFIILWKRSNLYFSMNMQVLEKKKKHGYSSQNIQQPLLGKGNE